MKLLLRLSCCLLVVALARASYAQQAPIPEMKRLQDAFVGDWKTAETMERTRFFPNGGARTGIAHFRLGPGGYSLTGEGQSDGSAGKLEFMIIVWWDPAQHLYPYFVCFNGAKPCRIRGSAHWEGNDFVNDYESAEGGKNAKWRDTFTAFTPNSFTLVAARRMEDGSMKTIITTTNARLK